MKKRVVLYAVVLLASFISAQQFTQIKPINEISGIKKVDTIKDSVVVWSKDFKLTWDYFKGKPFGYDGFHAVTFINISYKNLKVYTDSVTIDLPCYFIVYESWNRDTTESLLNHEQRHFDIGEIIARKMRKELSNYVSVNDKETTLFLKSISNKYYINENNLLNDAYDKETSFSKNKDGQKRWDAKIDKMLKELDAYSNPHVVIPRRR